MSEYEGERLLIGLSGGINSMAVLCWLKRSGIKPKEVHLFYAHLEEHSDDTFPFVKAGIKYARKHFDNVFVKVTRNSVLRFFEEQKLIPHPTNGVCSRLLKIIPMTEYAFRNEIKHDLVGYIRTELKRRAKGQNKNQKVNLFSAAKSYPIGEFDDEWCLQICDEEIGWHPAIYDIRDANGKRIFKHNNCLPCKNMTTEDMKEVRTHFPKKHARAMETTKNIKSYWGRQEADFYAEFGRDLGQEPSCEVCQF